MSYRDKIQAKIKDPQLMRHGEEIFDREFFGVIFKKYNKEELLAQCKWNKLVLKFIEKNVPFGDVSGKEVMDIGCGWGALPRVLKDKGFEVTATDISSFIIKKVRKIQKDIDFRVEDVEKGIGAAGKFDYIFALEVLEHLKNPHKAVSNIKKKLREGGYFIFSTPYPNKWNKADPTHVSINYPAYWISLGKDLGFKETSFKFATFIPFFYKYTNLFNFALPIRIDNRYINSTCFFFFKN